MGAEDICVLVGKLELFLLYCLFIHFVLFLQATGFGWPSKCLGSCVMYAHEYLSSRVRSCLPHDDDVMYV